MTFSPLGEAVIFVVVVSGISPFHPSHQTETCHVACCVLLSSGIEGLVMCFSVVTVTLIFSLLEVFQFY